MITAKTVSIDKQLEKEIAIREYEIYEERYAVGVDDKPVKIKVRVDTATVESLERDKEHLLSLIAKIDEKLNAIQKLSKEL